MKRLVWIPLLFCSASLALSLVCVAPARAEAEEGEPKEELDEIERSHRGAEERRKYARERRDEFKRDRETKFKRFMVDLEEKKARAEELGTDRVESNDVLVEKFDEPGTPDAVVDKPPIKDPWDPTISFKVIRHDPWALRKEDFRFWRPVRVNIERPLGARGAYEVMDFVPQTKRMVFRDVFLTIPFMLTNSTDKKLMICPRMWIVSENLRFTPEIGGFIAQQDVERSMFRDLNSTFDLIGYIKDMRAGGTDPVQVFQPGETRQGVAVFPLPDAEFDKITLVVEGLNNTCRYGRRQKRVLAIEFEHPGDEFHPARESTELRSKEWKWMWMWYEELQVSPLDRFEFRTPTDARQKILWSYQMTLTNKSGEPQELAIRRIGTVFKTQALGVNVEVEFVDTGKSTIHKAHVMEEMAQPFQGERFFSGRLAPDDVKVFPVVFDEEDIEWNKVYEQVERGLMWDEEKQRGKVSIGYVEQPLKPGLESFMPDLERLRNVRLVTLKPEQKAQVRKEVLQALPDVMAAERKNRMLTLQVTAVSGMASGTFRIRRSYFKKGVIEEEWIHKWEE